MTARTDEITAKLREAGLLDEFRKRRLELESDGFSKKDAWEQAAADFNYGEGGGNVDGQTGNQAGQAAIEKALVAKAEEAQAANAKRVRGGGGQVRKPSGASDGVGGGQSAQGRVAGPGGFTLASFGDDWQADTADTIRFVALTLHAVDVEPGDAPNPEAANMLIWARRTVANENEFWKSIYPKLLVKKELEGSKFHDDGGHLFPILEGFDESLEAGPDNDGGEYQLPEELAAPLPGE